MKKFNLEKANAGEPVVTKDGRDVRIVCFDHKSMGKSYTIVALVNKGDYEENLTYTNDGKFNSDTIDSNYDLFMKPVEKIYHYVFMNI